MRQTVSVAAPFLAGVIPALSGAQVPGATDPFGDLPGVVLSLALVVGVILAGAWVLRRTPLAAATRGSGPLKILATLPLGPKERLLLVEADGCAVLIGVSPAGMVALHRSVGHESAEGVSQPQPRALPVSLARSMDPAMGLGERP